MNRMEDYQDLPAELVEQLREATSHPVFVPDEIDQRVLSEASKHLSRQAAPRRHLLIRRLAPIAAAACLALAFFVILATNATSQSTSSPTVATNSDVSGESEFSVSLPQAGDIDADGVIDIVDALMLSKRLGDSKRWPDLNADGVVNEADVDLLVMQIVYVSEGAG